MVKVSSPLVMAGLLKVAKMNRGSFGFAINFYKIYTS